jgi:hypothetical protein
MPEDNANMQSGNSKAKTSTSGDPSEDRTAMFRGVRPGQLDWVAPISSAADFRMWSFKFRVGASTYLSKEVYPEEDKQHMACLNALLKASTLGGFAKMDELIMLLDSQGVKCEDMLIRLQSELLPSTETDRIRATDQFMSFQRGGTGLMIAARELGQLVLKCNQLGYKPDADTVSAKYKSLLSQSERPLFELYHDGIVDVRDALQRTIQAVEKLARAQDGGKQAGGNGASTGISCTAKDFKSKPKRAGFNPKGPNGKGDSKSACGKCGKKSCEGGAKCSAADKECYKCGKKGHLQALCRSAGKGAGGKAAAAVADGSEPDFK